MAGIWYKFRKTLSKQNFEKRFWNSFQKALEQGNKINLFSYSSLLCLLSFSQMFSFFFPHINKVKNRFNRAVYMLRKLRYNTNPAILEVIYNSLFGFTWSGLQLCGLTNADCENKHSNTRDIFRTLSNIVNEAFCEYS